MKLTRRDRKAIVYTVLGVPASIGILYCVLYFVNARIIDFYDISKYLKMDYSTLDTILIIFCFSPILIAILYWAYRFINKEDSE